MKEEADAREIRAFFYGLLNDILQPSDRELRRLS
jgi:hypothetical protein